MDNMQRNSRFNKVDSTTRVVGDLKQLGLCDSYYVLARDEYW
jgi:hypothetical protein